MEDSCRMEGENRFTEGVIVGTAAFFGERGIQE
jgi:hypothetical protein